MKKERLVIKPEDVPKPRRPLHMPTRPIEDKSKRPVRRTKHKKRIATDNPEVE